ncbi:MAG: NAD(P)H-dependent glycerol-3-phosphate dehydrogenase [Bacillota bacterium]
MQTKDIAVLGAGGWGTAVALVLARKGHKVTIWARRPEFCAYLQQQRENSQYLPGVLLPSKIEITSDLGAAVSSKEVVVIATPAKAVRTTIEACKDHLDSRPVIVSLSKGFERETFLRCSQVLAEVTGDAGRIVVLSGPNHAEEVARDIPTATVVAGNDPVTAELVQEIFMTPKFRVYTNPDIIGVEVAGALKNIIALAAGVCDGLGYGDNSKAALMTRGIAEIARMGVKLGAQPLTFAGLAGIGDLIATCTSKHSRNWRTGFALGKGESLESILGRTGMVVEGVATTEAAAQLAQKLEVSMPITTALWEVIFACKSPHQAVSELMMRGKANEIEEIDVNQ